MKSRRFQTLNRLCLVTLSLAMSGAIVACGQSGKSNLKIIGGVAVSQKESLSRHVAALVTSKKIVQCTATAIGPSTFITAAHCIYGKNLEGWTIQSGLSPGKGETLTVVSGEIHPDYDPSQMRTLSPELPPNDLAIIKTGESTRSIIPVPIIRRDLNHLTQSELKVTVAGYGRTDGTDPQSTGKLQKVSLSIESFNDEAREFSTYSEEGKMGCHVDSGAPAFMQYGEELILVGTVSRGDRLCTSGKTVYTDLSHFQDFVTGNIN